MISSKDIMDKNNSLEVLEEAFSSKTLYSFFEELL